MTIQRRTILMASLIGIASLMIFQQINANAQTTEDMKTSLAYGKDIITDKMIVDKASKKPSDIPIFTTYVDGDTNTLVVGIDENAPLTKQEYQKKIKTIVGNIPFDVKFGHFDPTACTGQLSTCTPLIAGIGINMGGKGSTITIAATDTSGKKGLVVSGHANGVGCGKTGLNAIQGNNSDETARVIGTILKNPPPDSQGKRLSDSAFVEFKKNSLGKYTYSAENKIYKGSDTSYTILGKSTASYQTPVYMQGVKSGLKTGYVVSSGSLTVNQPSCAILTGLQAMNFVAQDGDSGGPVFSKPNTSNQVYFYGIQVGNLNFNDGTSVAVFSPWSNIKTELQLQ